MYYRALKGDLFNIARSYLLLNCVNVQGESLSDAFKEQEHALPAERLYLSAVHFQEHREAHNIATVVLSEDQQIFMDIFKEALSNVYLLCKEQNITHIAMPALNLPFSIETLKELVLTVFYDLPVDFVVVDKHMDNYKTTYRRSIFASMI